MGLAISHWNIFLICPKEDKVIWLTKAKKILQPLRETGATHGQLDQLWGLVTRELDKRG